MDLLKKYITEKAEVREGNIVKVSGFLNHLIDVKLYREIGKEFAERFQGSGVNKILTIEASGIGLALSVAMAMGDIPVLFAKKQKSKNIDGETYVSSVKSYTKGISYDVTVESKHLTQNDNILIIDDFLANGQAALGLADIVKQAGAKLAGIGIVIEKGYQDGGRLLRGAGYRVESLAIIDRIEDGEIKFKD